jgi:hypothetical protein
MVWRSNLCDLCPTDLEIDDGHKVNLSTLPSNPIAGFVEHKYGLTFTNGTLGSLVTRADMKYMDR